MSQHHSAAFLKKVRRIGRMLNLLGGVSPTLAGRAAFKLFCTPRRLPPREEDLAFLRTAEQDTLLLGNLPIRTYAWRGEKPQTVLFLHGWESHSGRWRRYIAPLREAGLTVWAFDAPAHGQSGGRLINLPLYSKVLKSFMETRGVPDAMVGHSLGGAAVIMSMGAFDAPKVRRAVVLAGFAESRRVMDDFGRLLGLEAFVLDGVNREIERRSGIPVEAYSVQGKAALLTDVAGLVVHDLDDDVAPVAEGRAVAEAWRADYLETRGLGHRLQGKAAIQAVTDFLLREAAV